MMVFWTGDGWVMFFLTGQVYAMLIKMENRSSPAGPPSIMSLVTFRDRPPGFDLLLMEACEGALF